MAAQAGRAVVVFGLGLALSAFLGACDSSSGGSSSDPGDVVGVDDLGGGGFESRAYGVSGDGSTVVGESSAGAGIEGFRWTPDDGIESLGGLPLGEDDTRGFAASNDGSVVVGQTRTAAHPAAFRWSPDDEMQDLGTLPLGNNASIARAVTPDGSAAAGYSGSNSGQAGDTGSNAVFEAFRWNWGLDATPYTVDDEFEGLGDLPGRRFGSRAYGISADGNIVVGRGTSSEFAHSGVNDPTLEGWTVSGTGAGVVAGESPAGDLPAWTVDDTSSTIGTDSTLFYAKVPSAEQVAEAETSGWILKATLRVENVPDVAGFSIFLEYATGERRYTMAWGRNAAGQAIVALWDGDPGMTLPPSGPFYLVEIGGGDFHTYELRFDVIEENANFFLDGVEQIKDYEGHTFDAVATGRRVAWGSDSNEDVGRADYAEIEWGLSDPVTWSRQEAFRWDPGTDGIAHTGDDVMYGLGDLPGGGFASEARAISADGEVIVGVGRTSQGDEAFRWEDTGTCDRNNAGPDPCMVGLGDLGGGDFSSRATATSADGSVIVGYGTSSSGFEAFVWDTANGMRRLADALEDQGFDTGDWKLSKAHDVSDDGTVIVGEGLNPEGEPEGWVVELD